MKMRYDIQIILSTDDAQQLDELTQRFNAVYAGQVDAKTPRQILETITNNAAHGLITTWAEMLNAKQGDQ